ncbi:MAG TPA: ABC transporter substrate-binding protein, partial [Actinoplanes sp.]
PAALGGFRFLAGIHQRTTAAILAPAGGGIGTPRDLTGKTLADLPGSTVRDLFPAYARLAGIDPARTTWVAATQQNMAAELSRGKVAGVGDTVAGRHAVEAATHRRTAVVLAYSDQLQDLYGDALATSTAYAQAQPGGARKFTAALLQGLADAIDDPAAAGVIMHKYVPAVSAEAATAELTLLAPYVRSSAEGFPVGALDANRVARGIALLQGAGQIGPGLTPDQVMTV